MYSFEKIGRKMKKAIPQFDLSLTEEDYLKTIFQLSEKNSPSQGVSTNDIAKRISISAASVSDMVKKLSQKGLVNYVKYQGVTLTNEGQKIALYILRKHRLWETFLVNKLRFKWDEVHQVAEQLEHIQSEELIERLDEFLEFPAYDPHGDPIPNKDGEITYRSKTKLHHAPLHKELEVIAVEENSPPFLKYLDRLQIGIGTTITIQERNEFDASLEVTLNQERVVMLSQKASEFIFVAKV